MNLQVVQVFDHQPRVTHSDRRRLSPHLSGWNRLCGLLAGDLVGTDDVKRLVLLEFAGKKRKSIIQKLVGYLHSKERKRILGAIK